MAKKLALTFGGYTYFDRTRALETGQIAPSGIDLTFQAMDITELFRRMAQGAEFDAAEMSTSTYMMMLGRGDERLIGIPVFLSRVFRHNMIFVNTAAGIERPDDLRGKNVGLLRYQMTAALWVRAFLQEDYGVKPSDINWWYGGDEAPPFAERYHHEPPPGVTIQRIDENKYLAQMFEDGELDAYVSFYLPKLFREGSPRVRRLFPNSREVEREYFRRTGFFPIMHMLVMRRDIYERHPWAAISLLEAFIESKRLGFNRLRDVGALAVTIPWLGSEIEEIDDLFGGDPFPYGFMQNRAIIDAMTRYSYEQGLTPRKFEPEELFAPETITHPGDTVVVQHAGPQLG